MKLELMTYLSVLLFALSLAWGGSGNVPHIAGTGRSRFNLRLHVHGWPHLGG